jgi:hypothetical protein
MKKVLSIFVTLVFGLALFVYALGSPVKSRAPGDQGCINQGSDRRLAARFICPAQQYLSWKSKNEPYFVSIGSPYHINVGVAWPPYLVINRYRGPSQWQMFRMGFRYDRNWRGYIFPTIAWKAVSLPLRY